jgi:hypothetical protein
MCFKRLKRKLIILFPWPFMKLSIQIKSKNILTKIMLSILFHIFNIVLLLHTNTLKLKLWNKINMYMARLPYSQIY